MAGTEDNEPSLEGVAQQREERRQELTQIKAFIDFELRLYDALEEALDSGDKTKIEAIADLLVFISKNSDEYGHPRTWYDEFGLTTAATGINGFHDGHFTVDEQAIDKEAQSLFKNNREFQSLVTDCLREHFGVVPDFNALK